MVWYCLLKIFIDVCVAPKMQTICDEPLGDNMKINHSIAATAFIATALLAACSTPQQTTPTSPYPASSTTSSTGFGVVDSIQAVNATANTSSGGIGLGTVAGGVVGGVLGNQVGGGRGRDAATVAGAVGGAVVGNQIENRNRQQQASAQQMYQVGIRLDNGSYQTVVQDSVADLSIGSRVRLENGRAYRY
jgi:outer membrane lipoprotein SlyB